jgi:hypothetical protein
VVAIRSTRIASTGPLLVFAVAVARPDSTARAAASERASPPIRREDPGDADDEDREHREQRPDAVS